MYYISTRGKAEKMTAGDACLKGIAEDGGLYVPERIPRLRRELSELTGLSYKQLAVFILKHYLTDFTDTEIEECVNNAYNEKFDDPRIAPLVTKGNYHFLELFHGPTYAFKDMALSILPHIMKTAARKAGMTKDIVILTSTSGDTGKAALEAFAGAPGFSIFVLYPNGKVSKVQQLQMTTQQGDNVCVVGINGNFDDCQTTMKSILTDSETAETLNKHNAVFSSANSINIGRLLPQIVYYFYAYSQMCEGGQIKCGDSINFAVPTGNFGNILAGYYAKKMGLPINKLICASNSNNVLTDFFASGVYDKNRPFVETMSPSMDILVSSNLERLVYHITNEPTAEKMDSLVKTGVYEAQPGGNDFFGAYATERETLEAIREVFESGYVIDTHTAVAYSCCKKYEDSEAGGGVPCVIVSTASPFKFAKSVLTGIECGNTYENTDEFECIHILMKKSGNTIPENIKNLRIKPVRHTICCGINDAKSKLNNFILR